MTNLHILAWTACLSLADAGRKKAEKAAPPAVEAAAEGAAAWLARAAALAFSRPTTTLGLVARALVAALVALAAAGAAALVALARSYEEITRDNAVDVDAWVGDTKPSFGSRVKVSLLHRFNVGFRVASRAALPLAEHASPFVKGLRVTSRLAAGALPPSPGRGGGGGDTKPFGPGGRQPPIVVGTIRMGFGHHRIAYAAASWGLSTGRATYFHDLLNIESAEATLIRDTDKLYSKGSRLASELGGPFERMWGALTKSGDENALRVTYQMGEHLRPLLMGLPRDAPIVATHCLVACVAVSCGFKKVVNLVIDNHAQWFVVVPGCLNLVQGPSNYHAFLRMGVPPAELALAGHWIPKDMVDNIAADCQARIKRAKSAAAAKPRRLLVPVGGAGAQRKFITKFVRALGGAVRDGSVQLLLNAGDHAHMRDAFQAALRAAGVDDYDTVDSIDGVRAFCERLRGGLEPAKPVTLFAFADYFPAVATTDLLSRVADVLCCKPSELAFYPVPKLMIRRVGDHEAYSALRASELGDGTLEARELDDALSYVKLFTGGHELLTMMNQSIMRNATIGAYDGCKKAIELAQSL